MLIEFFGENFGCFRDRFSLSLLATDVDPQLERGIVEVKLKNDPKPLRLLRAIAIYGPNASGKSTILRAASVLHELLAATPTLASGDSLPGYEPFGGIERPPPTMLGLKAVINQEVYEYQVEFSRKRVHRESLKLLGPSGEPSVLLDRKERSTVGQWTQDRQFELISQKFRPNALLLALADRFAPAVARNIAQAISSLTTFGAEGKTSLFGPDQPAARLARHDAAFAQWLKRRLQSADLGVVDFNVLESEIRLPAGFLKEIQRANPELAQAMPNMSYSLQLKHGSASKPFDVDYRRESGGTKRLVQLAPMLYKLAQAREPIAIYVDEIQESLHPSLLKHLLNEFNCATPMKYAQGQLIFATHEVSLIDAPARNAVLRRDQIYLTEKDADGAAQLYSLAEFNERQNVNLRHRYLEGRYGAIPQLPPSTFEAGHDVNRGE